MRTPMGVLWCVLVCPVGSLCVCLVSISISKAKNTVSPIAPARKMEGSLVAQLCRQG